jgi:hypothetical protein
MGGFFESITFVDNFNITNGVGVEPELQAFSIAPHPNPFTEDLRFRLSPTAKMPCTVALTDMTGRTVFTQDVQEPGVRIARNNLAPGIYALSVRDASGAASYSRIVAE